MAQNPYTPPTAQVKDRGPDRAIDVRPKEVIYAVWMLWLSIPLGIPASVYEYQRAVSQDPNPFVLPFFFAMYAIGMVLNVFIYRGHNWARLFTLIIYILAIVSFFALFNEYLEYPVVPLASNVVVLVLGVIALYLLFTRPGYLWFRRPG